MMNFNELGGFFSTGGPGTSQIVILCNEQTVPLDDSAAEEIQLPFLSGSSFTWRVIYQS